MSDRHARGNVTKYRFTPAIAEKRVRELAVNSGNVQWSSHALERMEERGIFDADVLRVLRGGVVLDEPEPGRTSGEWKCKMVKKIRGGRDVGVVTIIMKNNRLRVKTVEWEDLS